MRNRRGLVVVAPRLALSSVGFHLAALCRSSVIYMRGLARLSVRGARPHKARTSLGRLISCCVPFLPNTDCLTSLDPDGVM